MADKSPEEFNTAAEIGRGQGGIMCVHEWVKRHDSDLVACLSCGIKVRCIHCEDAGELTWPDRRHRPEMAVYVSCPFCRKPPDEPGFDHEHGLDISAKSGWKYKQENRPREEVLKHDDHSNHVSSGVFSVEKVERAMVETFGVECKPGHTYKPGPMNQPNLDHPTTKTDD